MSENIEHSELNIQTCYNNIIISTQSLQEYKDIHNIVKTIPLHNFPCPILKYTIWAH